MFWKFWALSSGRKTNILSDLTTILEKWIFYKFLIIMLSIMSNLMRLFWWMPVFNLNLNITWIRFQRSIILIKKIKGANKLLNNVIFISIMPASFEILVYIFLIIEQIRNVDSNIFFKADTIFFLYFNWRNKFTIAIWQTLNVISIRTCFTFNDCFIHFG